MPLRDGWCRAKIRLGYIFILKKLMRWPANSRNRTQSGHGDCTSLQCPIRMKRWSVSVGRVACADYGECAAGRSALPIFDSDRRAASADRPQKQTHVNRIGRTILLKKP